MAVSEHVRSSVRFMATAASQLQPVSIPDRLYFRIGDVCRLTGLQPYVLRYWESEFRALSPKKSGSNQRLYRRKDVEQVLEIKHLLYDEKFTIEGAREHLQKRKAAARHTPKPQPAPPAQGSLFGPTADWISQAAAIRAELMAVAGLLTK
jgi:DNA-binding transcriptional MerR regulator